MSAIEWTVSVSWGAKYRDVWGLFFLLLIISVVLFCFSRARSNREGQSYLYLGLWLRSFVNHVVEGAIHEVWVYTTEIELDTPWRVHGRPKISMCEYIYIVFYRFCEGGRSFRESS